MAKGNPFASKKAPPFGKGKPPAFGPKVRKEAKAEGEPPDVEAQEMAQGFKRGGRVGRK